MVLRHEWLSEARAEFEATLEYVRQEFGNRIVEDVYSDVLSWIRVLQTFPDAGQRYKDLFYKGCEVRILHMEKSSIFYCHDEETLYILAFWNNLRDDSVIAEILTTR